MALGHDTTLLPLLFYKGEAKEGGGLCVLSQIMEL